MTGGDSDIADMAAIRRAASSTKGAHVNTSKTLVLRIMRPKPRIQKYSYFLPQFGFLEQFGYLTGGGAASEALHTEQAVVGAIR